MLFYNVTPHFKYLSMSKPLKLFYSYSHRDELLRDELEKHLILLSQNSFIENWHDRKIRPGDEWDHNINEQILTADIILFLISVDFISSEYCNSIEVKKAIDRHQNGEVKCIPIFLNECNFGASQFSKLQGLPRDAHFVTDKKYWSDLHKPFTIISKELENEIKAIWNKREKESQRYRHSITGEVSIDTESDEDFLAIIKVLREKESMLSPLSTEKEIRELRDLREKVLKEFDLGRQKIDNIPVLVEKYPIELFNSIYSSETLSKPLRDEIQNIRSNDNYKWHHRSLISSALTLSIINFKKVDQYKILLLLDFIKDEEEKVWDKSLAGLAIALTYRKNSWVKFPLVTQRLKSLRDSIKIQEGLERIGFILEHALYNIYFISEEIFKIDFYKNNPAHCFIPFYENNKAIEYFFDNSVENNPEDIIAGIKDSPIPDILKYYICYSEPVSRRTSNQNLSKRVSIWLNYVLQRSSLFKPYLQYLNELYAFINFYPTETKLEVFKSQLTLAETSLKDYLLSEVQKHRAIGRHFINLKDFTNAASHFNDLLKFKDDDIEALKNLAHCLKKQKKFAELMKTLGSIEKYYPDDIENILELARIYQERGELEKASYYCHKTYSKELTKSQYYDRRGAILGNLHEEEKAFSDFNEAIKISSQNDIAYMYRAIYYEFLFMYEKALYDFESAIANDPKKCNDLPISRHLLF